MVILNDNKTKSKIILKTKVPKIIYNIQYYNILLKLTMYKKITIYSMAVNAVRAYKIDTNSRPIYIIIKCTNNCFGKYYINIFKKTCGIDSIINYCNNESQIYIDKQNNCLNVNQSI